MVVREIEAAIGMEINGPLAWVEFLSKKEKKNAHGGLFNLKLGN